MFHVVSTHDNLIVRTYQDPTNAREMAEVLNALAGSDTAFITIGYKKEEEAQ
jgi:hypothetical protein